MKEREREGWGDEKGRRVRGGKVSVTENLEVPTLSSIAHLASFPPSLLLPLSPSLPLISPTPPSLISPNPLPLPLLPCIPPCLL